MGRPVKNANEESKKNMESVKIEHVDNNEINIGIKCTCGMIEFDSNRAVKKYGKNSKADGKVFEKDRFKAGVIEMKLRTNEKISEIVQKKTPAKRGRKPNSTTER